MEKADGAFRILTINTWKGDGNYEWRIQMMAQELYGLQPDIVCLQEAVRTADFKIDTAQYLADFLGMEMVYAPARLKQRTIEKAEHFCHSGLAILSASPIETHWFTAIPTCEEDPERLTLTAQLYRNEKLITITNLHLTHIAGRNALRLEQFVQTVTKNIEATGNSYWFCCGDYNCFLDQTILDAVETKTRPVKIHDCYLDGGGKLPGETLAYSDTAPGNNRIDYIFSLVRHSSNSFETRNAKIVLNNPDFEGCYPSDHFGVCVDIHFTL